jgi:hypothetical protein
MIWLDLVEVSKWMEGLEESRNRGVEGWRRSRQAQAGPGTDIEPPGE